MTSSLIRQYYGFFNERRLSDAAGLFADDADVELIPGERARGGDGYVRFAETWLHAFPDATLTVQHVVGSGNSDRYFPEILTRSAS